MATKNIKAIVVGAGFAGLSAAIELADNGVEVEVFEAVKELTTQGDILLLSANATRIIGSWGDVLEKVVATSGSPPEMTIADKSGNVLLHQPLDADFQGSPNVYSNRGLTQKFVYEHALSLGIKVHLSSRVESYFEDENSAGIKVNGVDHRADFVLCGDGIHSRARSLITGYHENPKTSGFAVFRSWFPLDRLKGNPLTEKFTKLEKDYFQIWIGEDVHAILNINVALKSAVCFCTHKDSYSLEESWSFPGKVEDMLEVVSEWDETLKALMKAIPGDKLIDWKLLWRDPINTWVSKEGRIALIGDAAHPHLATSGSGAAQAIEDGATIAAAISKSGKSNIPTALKAFQALRFDRTNLTQRLGWETRHRWHQTDWDAIKNKPELLQLPQPAWLFGLNARTFALENYDAAAKHVTSGAPFKATNVPEDYKYEKWSVETMLALEGKKGNEALYQVKTT